MDTLHITRCFHAQSGMQKCVLKIICTMGRGFMRCTAAQSYLVMFSEPLDKYYPLESSFNV